MQLDDLNIPFYSRQLFYPAPALRHKVDSYCVLRPSREVKGHIPWHVMPDGACYILFHVYKTAQLSSQPAFHSRLVFVGPRSIYLLTDRKQRVLSFIAMLKPGANLLKYPLPLRELKDRSIAFEELISRDLTREKEEWTSLAVSNQIPELVSRFDRLLLEISSTPIQRNALVTAAVQTVNAARGQWPVNKLASFLGVSERHVRSVFNKNVGLSPKRYSRIVRLTETVKAVDAGFSFGQARLALDAGFYDQSHMIDEFQELVGESTEAFIARPNREEVLMMSSDFSNT